MSRLILQVSLKLTIVNDKAMNWTKYNSLFEIAYIKIVTSINGTRRN